MKSVLADSMFSLGTFDEFGHLQAKRIEISDCLHGKASKWPTVNMLTKNLMVYLRFYEDGVFIERVLLADLKNLASPA